MTIREGGTFSDDLHLEILRENLSVYQLFLRRGLGEYLSDR